MGALLQILGLAPPFGRKLALVAVFRATASAFDRTMPQLHGLSPEQCLHAYAVSTSEWAGDALQRGPDQPALEARLYENACRLARTPGWLFHVRTVDRVTTLAQFIYSILGIDLQGTDSGEITIRTCYFSRFYSAEVCRLMSAMDRGLFAGLSGGGELSFSRRITEGHPCCQASFAAERPEKERFRCNVR
jgi:hypothetical protein